MNTTVTPDIYSQAVAFSDLLVSIKRNEPFNWYPHDIMASFHHSAGIIPAHEMDGLAAGGKRILDIGAADGDLGYFYASLGCDVTFIDNPPTNFNKCEGMAKLGGILGYPTNLIEADVDFGLEIDGQYDLAICLGLMYHLRNPMLLLMTLAQHAEHMVLSNRIMTHLPDGTDVSGLPISYALECRESNNDPTNYYTMTPMAMCRMLKRAGWIVRDSKITGAEVAHPYRADMDARMFVYCDRVDNWADLRNHHDF